MHKATKIVLLCATGAVVLGCLIAFVGLCAVGFDFAKLNTARFDERVYEIDKPFQSIDIKDMDGDIEFLYVEEGPDRVICSESTDLTHTVSVRDDTLIVQRLDGRPWYKHFGFWWGSGKVTVCLRASEFETLQLKTLSGDITVPDGFRCENAVVSAVSGDVFFRAAAAKSLTASSTSGDVTVGNACGTVAVSSVSGDVKIANVLAETLSVSTTSGDIRLDRTTVNGMLNAKSVSGDIRFDDTDVGSAALQTTSGDINGAFETPKNVETHTTSGAVNVSGADPTAALCTAKTVSGDILIQIK